MKIRKELRRRRRVDFTRSRGKGNKENEKFELRRDGQDRSRYRMARGMGARQHRVGAQKKKPFRSAIFCFPTFLSCLLKNGNDLMAAELSTSQWHGSVVLTSSSLY